MSYRNEGGGRGPPPRIDNLTSVKVDNLSRRCAPDELRRLFDRYGEIGDVHIPRRFGESRGFAFVRFVDKRDAQDSIDDLDQTFYQGRKIGVCLARYGRPVDEGDRDRRSSPRRDRRRRTRSRSPPPRRRQSSSRSRSGSPPPRRDRKRSDSRSRSKSKSASRSKSR